MTNLIKPIVGVLAIILVILAVLLFFSVTTPSYERSPIHPNELVESVEDLQIRVHHLEIRQHQLDAKISRLAIQNAQNR